MEYTSSTNQSPIFQTSSLQLAAYLYSRNNLSFSGASSTGEQVSFNFMPYSTAQTETEAYYSGHGQANPLVLFQNYQTLKEMLFEVKRNPS